MSSRKRASPRAIAGAMAAIAALTAIPAAAQMGGLANGQRIYQAHCAGCHGVNGIPVMPQAPSFARSERLNQPDPMLAVTVRMGRTAMPAFIGILNDREIFDVLSYLRTMRR